jgi:OHCU decarboxylase
VARDVAALDALSASGFVAAAAPWFEGAPRFLARLAAARPFGDESTLFARVAEIALAMPEDEQIELINAHPRLGAPPASVSAASFREQGYDRETTAAIADLARLNADYEARNGFRFVTFVNRRPKAAVLEELRERIERPREEELRRATRELVAIARDRWQRG